MNTSHAQHFADQIRVMAALQNSPAAQRVLDVFRAIPRETFAGPGPWKLLSPHEGFGLPVFETPDDDPKWLYNSVLIVVDEAKGLNIGDPAFWARRFSRADIKPGTRILQVGAGVGYYTAILSQLAGPDGSVVAYEVEEPLAHRAKDNLLDQSNVEVRLGNAATDLSGNETFDLIVAFAGITHVPEKWASHLAPGGRLLVPLTGADWWGAMILAERRGDGFDAVTLGRVGVYPCSGARDDVGAQQISELFKDPSLHSGCRLRLTGLSTDMRIERMT